MIKKMLFLGFAMLVLPFKAYSADEPKYSHGPYWEQFEYSPHHLMPNGCEIWHGEQPSDCTLWTRSGDPLRSPGVFRRSGMPDNISEYLQIPYGTALNTSSLTFTGKGKLSVSLYMSVSLGMSVDDAPIGLDDLILKIRVEASGLLSGNESDIKFRSFQCESTEHGYGIKTCTFWLNSDPQVNTAFILLAKNPANIKVKIIQVSPRFPGPDHGFWARQSFLGSPQILKAVFRWELDHL